MASKDLFCHYCKEQGYLLENCELRLVTLEKKKNQGNSNRPWKSGV